MSIVVDEGSRVIVQGMGKTGRFHTDKAIAYGTNMVAAVHPSRAGHACRETRHRAQPGTSHRHCWH